MFFTNGLSARPRASKLNASNAPSPTQFPTPKSAKEGLDISRSFDYGSEGATLVCEEETWSAVRASGDFKTVATA